MNQCLAVINMMQILCLFCLQDMYAILALNWRLIDIYGVLCSLSQTTKMLLQQLVWPQKCTNVSVRPDNTGIAFLHYFWDLQVKVRSVPLSDFGIKVQTSISATNTRLCDIRNIVIALPGNPLTLKSLIQPRCLKSPFNGYGGGLGGGGMLSPTPPPPPLMIFPQIWIVGLFVY